MEINYDILMYNILMHSIRCEFKENNNVDLPTMVSQMLCHITLLTLSQVMGSSIARLSHP